MEISVCIATYHRPAGLGRLLRSIETQQGELPPFEVVVVDNDEVGSAECIWRGFAERLNTRYVVEPIRGIASARNRSVLVSQGRYLAFIDDDEEASPNWLATLYAQAIRCDADAVFGPVVTKFERSPPGWIRDCSVFQHPVPADGTTVPLDMTRTGNALVRRAALPDQTAPFDSSLIGGSDSVMFGRMIGCGAKCIAATQAVVFEHCPIARANAAWVIRGRFLYGGRIARRHWHELSRAQRLHQAFRASGEVGHYVFAALRCLPQSQATAFEHVLQAVKAFGKIAWVAGVKYSEHHR